jgi:hypothetical protein
MPYFQTDETGAINGEFALPQPGNPNFIELDEADARVVAWRTHLESLTIPQVISDRQFFQQLAIDGVITQDEALAAVKTGTLPASLVSLVNSLPADKQFDANMLLCGATQFVRSHPMVPVLGTAFGWDDAQMNALWVAASQL